MEFCTLHLAHGSTILSTSIKSDTITHYLKVISSAPLNHKQPDPLLDERGLEAQHIKNFLSEIKRWESMKNCREPVTVKMALYMLKSVRSST